FISGDRYFLILLVAALALGLGEAYVRDFLPFVVLILLYEEVTAGEDLAESTPPKILAEPLSTTSESEPELQEEPVDLSRWEVTNYHESPFEKCGRLFIEGNDLIIRSELDTRGFCISLVDVIDVLDGETVPVLLLGNGTQVGVAKRSASGKAMNFWIEPFLYTSPLARVMDVLEGRARKAAVFVGREVVEG
ncbi:MAG TPA: hypothetical protein PK272_08280, partial [Methanoregulaceae archaeon]|nr:hypothetical protein [Methanoregulaceae archaeon]